MTAKKPNATIVGLGGASERAVEAVVSHGAAVLSVADAGTKESFVDAWTRTLAEHARTLRAKGEELQHPVVLVYVPDWAAEGRRLGWNRRAMLGARASEPLAGTFGIGALNVGAYTSPQQVTDTADVETMIEGAQLGGHLTIALMSSTELWIWMHGLDASQQPYRRPLDDGLLIMSLQTLDEKLTEFYEQVARQTQTWWEDATKRVTRTPPEATVQHDLWLYLLGAYADRAKVRQELKIGNGRADLVVTPNRPIDASAVLELKATRDCNTPKPGTKTPGKISLKENLAWAASGVQQTAAYRDQEKFDGAFLCVYDFCAGPMAEIDKTVQDAANQYGVMGRRYWITASNDEHRKERYPLAPPPAAAPAARTSKPQKKGPKP
ncbi:hypothetical protein [Roseateles sp.]|uniref:hypothetical protein n=1 Tax=Roseateles sp. TaxID=1971397 RepID=UPI0039E97407